MSPKPQDGSVFWERFHEAREDAERRLLDKIENALQESPRESAQLLRGWMRADKMKKPEEP